MERLSPQAFTPETASNQSVGDAAERTPNESEMRAVLEQMYARQQQMEKELAATRAALERAEAAANQTQPRPAANPADTLLTNELLQALVQSLTAATSAQPAPEHSGSREWKPPTWDGRTETFRDYLLRIKSSFQVRSAVRPTLPDSYYWDTIYNTLPLRERARMRHFWQNGHELYGKQPASFFTQLEKIYADSNEQPKALEQLTLLRHSNGQPWHEHQIEFDGLLLSAGGDQWTNAAKIGYLKNTFSNPVKTYTAAMPKYEDYYAFSEEVERIMTNLESTDQYKKANKQWNKEKDKGATATVAIATRAYGTSSSSHVDADGDTIMAPTQTGKRNKERGPRRATDGNQQRAKWVESAEIARRREKKLCYRCGADGHRLRDCPYLAAIRPTNVNTTRTAPLLESDGEESDAASADAGKD
jgi:hypothetical protein